LHNPAIAAAGALREASQFGAALRQTPINEPEKATRIPLSDGSTLSEFFADWYLPVVLKTKNSVAGEQCYRRVLNWWQLLTCDPPLREIDDRLVAAFLQALATAEYRRGPGKELRRLSRVTIATFSVRLRTLLTHAGSGTGHGPAARLIEHRPAVPTVGFGYRPKPCWTLEEMRAISAAVNEMKGPPAIDRFTVASWWRAWLALAYYTGLRFSTIFALHWRNLIDVGEQLYLDISAEQVTKTGKAIRLAVHPQLADVLRSIRYGTNGNHLIVPPACHRRTFNTLHRRLQTLAGLKGAAVLPPHAWRRTHGQRLSELGLGNAEQLAQLALDHGDVRTTKSHYIAAVDHFRLRLPLLWPHGVSNERQLGLW
jgi:integrase